MVLVAVRGFHRNLGTGKSLSFVNLIMIKKLLNWLESRKQGLKLENWFVVSWDNEYIYRKVSPPGKEAWNDRFRWDEIERICFEATDYMYSDDIYFFTSQRPESYVIPTESKGGHELWLWVIEKKLYDPELATKAALATHGMFCWPPIES